MFGEAASRYAVLRFAPESASLQARDRVVRLSWNDVVDPTDLMNGDYPAVWGRHWGIVPPIRYERSSIRVGDERYRFGSLLDGPMLELSYLPAAAVLCAYLRDFASARAALNDRDRCNAVVAGLDRHLWFKRTTTPLAGAALDVTRHLPSALRGLGAHCYLGRLVEGEVVPTSEQVVDAVRVELPSFVTGHAATPEAITKRYEKIMAARPWPFAALQPTE